MYSSMLTSKRKHGLFSLAILASLTCSQALLAMDTLEEDDSSNQQKSIPYSVVSSSLKLSEVELSSYNNASGFLIFSMNRQNGIEALKTCMHSPRIRPHILKGIKLFYERSIQTFRNLLPQCKKTDIDTLNNTDMHTFLSYLQNEESHNGKGVPLNKNFLEALAYTLGGYLEVYEKVDNNRLQYIYSLGLKDSLCCYRALQKGDGNYNLLKSTIIPLEVEGGEIEDEEIDTSMEGITQTPNLPIKASPHSSSIGLHYHNGEGLYRSQPHTGTDAKKRKTPHLDEPPAKRLKSTPSENCPNNCTPDEWQAIKNRTPNEWARRGLEQSLPRAVTLLNQLARSMVIKDKRILGEHKKLSLQIQETVEMHEQLETENKNLKAADHQWFKKSLALMSGILRKDLENQLHTTVQSLDRIRHMNIVRQNENDNLMMKYNEYIIMYNIYCGKYPCLFEKYTHKVNALLPLSPSQSQAVATHPPAINNPPKAQDERTFQDKEQVKKECIIMSKIWKHEQDKNNMLIAENKKLKEGCEQRSKNFYSSVDGAIVGYLENYINSTTQHQKKLLERKGKIEEESNKLLLNIKGFNSLFQEIRNQYPAVFQ